ncbi:hypothetical protein N665_0025s0155 [Sinapis alba]|nr:hypothetical protein N665_0025s0155 [Sinapis alba]
MESDGQRVYSVLTRTDVREKMMKEIVQISEVFSLSHSDATVALIRLGWDSFRASDLLGDDKEKFLSELGLVQVSDSNHEMIDGDVLVSTPFCSHKFCSDCWRDYLSESLEKKSTCLDQDCVVSVGVDTIEKLAEPVKEMYEKYVVGSFMESNKIKRCPASGCEYVIERHEDPSSGEDDGGDRESSDFGVVCLCGHTFCWSCKLESHRPVTCNNASLWLNELLDQARRLTLVTTKPCPHCQSRVERHLSSYLRIVTCVVCSYTFCWRCLQPEECHGEEYYCSKVFVPPPREEAALRLHFPLWKEGHKAMEVSKHELETIERNIIPVLTQKCGLGDLDMRAVREACMLIVQCRLVLKWSSLFGYFITDYHSSRKQYLDHLVEEATANLLKHKGTLDELVNGAISRGDITGFRHKLETSTTTTGNYFHFFVKTVEDGMCEVKAGVFENVAIDYWFCDRCTFQNEGFERKCRVCVFPFEGPSPPFVALGNHNNNNSTAIAHDQQQLPNVSSNPFASPQLLSFGINNSSASAHQQQAGNPFARQGGTNTVAFGAHQQGVPNMSSNPFAREGGTNVFESAPFGNSNSAHQQQVPNMSNNPFTLPVAFGNINLGASVYQQQVPNMASNPFASPGGTSYFQMSPPRVAYGNNSIGASEGPIFFQSYPLVTAYGNNSALQQQVPNMANNPFARPGGTYPLQYPPFVAFGNNNNGSASASAHQQPQESAPYMMVNSPFAHQGGTNPLESRRPHVGASAHQQQASNMPPSAAGVKEELD